MLNFNLNMNKFKSIIALFTFGLLLATAGCDIINPPYKEPGSGDTSLCPPQNFPVNNNPIRKILLEDYTGHTCGNCPQAAATAQSLKNTYGDQLVIMAVHCGFFAEPVENTPFTTDFRTTVGNDLDQQFGCSAAGLPRGMVDRKKSGSSPVLAHTAWASMVQSIINLPPDLDIQIIPNYDAGSRTACADVQVKFLKNISDDLKICVYLTEDSIIDWQKDYSANPPEIENYVHRHVLRGSFNGSWGDSLGIAPFAQSDMARFRYALELDSTWNESHCSILTYVYNTSSDEVLQAEEAHLP